ncbi:hypothetical protein C8Q77DRAFT_1154289 [Trametes polyzona]|nr:hypothetical protein C8Q77DRAFT_1154289 [Trametes polyzona]
MNRASASDRPRSSRRRSKHDSLDPVSPVPPTPVPSPPLEPPPLTSAYQSLAPPPPAPQPPGSDIPEPPDTPPPLAQAYPTLPPPTAPIYPQLPLPGRDPVRSARSTPEASYHSPVSYAHSSLATAASYPQYDDHTYPSSQESRNSSSFGRASANDDSRWAYPQQQQSYSASGSDRYSPASPVANAQYTAPASPVDAYNVGTHRASGPGNYQMTQESVSYYGQYQQRQTSTALAPTVGSPGPLSQPQQQQSSHRHSIAHISNPVNRQHSPTTSANSASPIVSHPSTPGYGYVSSSMGSYPESPPGSESPVAPPSSQLPSGMVATATAYGYESNSLASAGYALPPPQPQVQHQQTQGYDRTLPSLSPVHSRESQLQMPPTLTTHFNYGQSNSVSYTSGSSGVIRHASPPPVLAPIQGPRMLRRDAGAVGTQAQTGAMRYASPPQPPMQSLASVSRSSGGGHAFSYPPPPSAHSPTYASSSYGSASASSASAAAGGSGYYYQPSHQQQHQHQQNVHGHGHREPSPEPVDAGSAAEQYLELHQPQPQRHAGHQHQYMQTGAVLGGASAHAHAHTVHHPVWRAEDYHRGRGGLVQ